MRGEDGSVGVDGAKRASYVGDWVMQACQDVKGKHAIGSDSSNALQTGLVEGYPRINDESRDL